MDCRCLRTKPLQRIPLQGFPLLHETRRGYLYASRPKSMPTKFCQRNEVNPRMVVSKFASIEDEPFEDVPYCDLL